MKKYYGTALNKKIYEDDVQVQPKLEQFSQRLRLHLLTIKRRLFSYPSRVLEGFRIRWYLFAIAATIVIVISTLMNLFSCNLCITSMPIQLSTSFSRMTFSPSYCSMLNGILNKTKCRVEHCLFSVCNCASRFEHFIDYQLSSL